MGKKKTNTTTTGLDPQSQAYVNSQRQMAQSAAAAVNAGPEGGGAWTQPQTMSVADQIGAFMNPYTKNVVDATRGEFDFMRAGALNDVKQNSTMGGAYGGSRAAVLAGSRLGALDRAQGSTVADLLNRGFSEATGNAIPYFENQRLIQQQIRQDPLFRAQQGMNFMNLGMGPTGSVSSNTESGNFWSGAGDFLKTAGGIGATLYGAGAFGGGGGAPAASFRAPSPWTPPQFNMGMPSWYNGQFNLPSKGF